MTLRSSSRTHLLLVNPAQAQWLDAQGQALPEPPSAAVGVRVVADLVEETHVRIEVPGLLGGDRQKNAFILERAGFSTAEIDDILNTLPA